MEKEKMLRTKKRKKKRKRKKTKEGKTERKEKKKMALHPDRNAETRLEGQQLRYNQKDARQVQRLKKKKKKKELGTWILWNYYISLTCLLLVLLLYENHLSLV